RAVRRDGDAMGAQGKLPIAPGPQEVAFLIIDDDRMIAAADQVDAILAVDGYPRDVAVRVALRQLLPAFDDRIVRCHRCPPVLTRARRRGGEPSPCSFPRCGSVASDHLGGGRSNSPPV